MQKKAAWGTDTAADAVLDKEKVQEAMKRLEEEEAAAAGAEHDERKRKYNSIAGSNAGVTDEEMEAYRLRKARADDPMAHAAGTSAQNGYDYV